MPRLRSLLLAVALTVAVPGYGMDVTRDEQRNEFTLFLTGPIVAGDLKKIVAAVTPPARFPNHFTLDSPGGNLIESMAIGKFIRETASATFVAKNCSSACVFVLVAGTSKNARDGAAVGIHRPYFEPKEYAGLSLPDAEKRYKELRAFARRYLAEDGNADCHD